MKLSTDFLNSIKNIPELDMQSFLNVHKEEKRITSLRLNPFKPVELDFKLNEKVAWTQNGYYLNERPLFTFDPLFHAGTYYVQEAGSMFIEFLVQNSIHTSEKLCVLDLCAAPGGKSTLLNSIITEDSVLVSNEIIKQRAEVLSYNLSKWGTCNNIVTNCDPISFGKLQNTFDLIVVDAPCSGSGLFRKQPEAINEWSVDVVNQCSIRQKKILTDSLPSLKEGGFLIYSTCSYSREENEDIVNWLMENFELELISIPIPAKWGIIVSENGYRFYPDKTESEGFFCSVLKKKGDRIQNQYNSKKEYFSKISLKEQSLFSKYIELNDEQIIFKFESHFKLVSSQLFNFLNINGNKLYLKKTGTTIGEFKQQDFLPHYELALSNYLNKDLLTNNIDKENSLKFLRKENFVCDSDKGIQLISYKNSGLGWIKKLDNRINNYLPKEFRILTNENH